MKKFIRRLSLVLAFALLAAVIPLLRGGGVTANAAGDFTIEDGVLKAYHGAGGDVVIPGGVTRIAESAFGYNDDVKSVKIPSSLNTVSAGLFCDCINLEKVTIAEGVRKIEFRAFWNCEKLSSVRLPASLSEMGEEVFRSCGRLQRPDIASGNPSFVFEDGVLYDKGRTRILYCATGKSGQYDMPDTVRMIDPAVFQYCVKLTGVTIPYGVDTIPHDAFFHCSGLTDVFISDSVTWIEGSAFKGCSSLKYVTVPESVARLDGGSFGECSMLETVTFLPKKVSVDPEEDESECPFSDCPKLAAINYAGTASEWRNSGIGYFFGSSVSVRYGYSAPLFIQEQPKSRTIAKGSSLTLAVNASGSGLKYQWYFMKSSATDWSVWNGRTHAVETCTPNDSWNGIKLYCEITDSAGTVVKSSPATITVK